MHIVIIYKDCRF